MNNKVELKVYTGIDFRGIEIKHDQDFVIVNGNKAGLLCHKPGSRIMPLINLPEPTWEDIVKECTRLRKHEVLPPFAFYVPPKATEQDEPDTDAGEEEDEGDFDV